MKHFIVTRFNLKVEQWKTAKDGSDLLTDKWLEDRFDLFKKYCFPSVVNQKNQHFSWLVFFDIDTSSEYRNIISRMSDEYSNLVPLFIDGNKSLQSSLKDYVLKHLDKTDEFFITTRLDNDDAIHLDFTETIQRVAVKKDKTIVDIRKGYQLNISGGVHEYRRLSNSFNPFVSLVEKAENFDTVISRKHNAWSDTASVVIYDKQPLWIEVIHQKNKLNTVRPEIPLIKKINLAEFGIDKNSRARNNFYILKNNFNVLARNLKKIIFLKTK